MPYNCCKTIIDTHNEAVNSHCEESCETKEINWGSPYLDLGSGYDADLGSASKDFFASLRP